MPAQPSRLLENEGSMRSLSVLIVLAALAGGSKSEEDAAERKPRVIEIQRIWGMAPHNAFTDLVRFKGRWYCTFREGETHTSLDGAIRILSSADGVRWDTAARISSPPGDLRDPKLNVTPDNMLMLNAAAAFPPGSGTRHQSLTWFSADGRTWGQALEIGDPNVWLWGLVWHQGRIYGIGYATGEKGFARLYTSRDGMHYDTLVPDLLDQGSPSEGALVFTGESTALCLLRRDGKGANAMLGRARAPYRAWMWQDLGARIGCPRMLRLDDGRIVVAGRLYDGKVRTALCMLDAETGKLDDFLDLPSGGDTGYPGMVYHDGVLWVSYYSSHDGKAAVYVARVDLGGRSKK
jgi:hypothetical protein